MRLGAAIIQSDNNLIECEQHYATSQIGWPQAVASLWTICLHFIYVLGKQFDKKVLKKLPVGQFGVRLFP